MRAVVANLLDRLASYQVADSDVIGWSSPVPAFGRIEDSKVASVGLNPSNREFVDTRGDELVGRHRRFHTLRSLGIESWNDADASDVDSIASSCRNYFAGNPYDGWFRRLDVVMQGAGASFYSDEEPAAHLDLSPYATKTKWGSLPARIQRRLLDLTAREVGCLVRDSDVATLVLNGKSVVEHFESLCSVLLKRHQMPSWTLPRQNGRGVAGIAFSGSIEELGGVGLGRAVKVLGYNHNLQSSFGVTNEVIGRIRSWIRQRARS